MDLQLQEVPLQNEDEKLLRSIVEYIEINILNESLSVEELSRQMNMSRGSLYSKVLMLTGKSPIEFIRSIRLKKAVYLLENSQMTISQICYEVGFNTPNILQSCLRRNIISYHLHTSFRFAKKKLLLRIENKA